MVDINYPAVRAIKLFKRCGVATIDDVGVK